MEIIDINVHRATTPFPRLNIYPVSDVQYGAQGCDMDRFKRYIQRGIEDEHGYFVGVGDLVDVASPSGRQKIKSADFYDSVTEALAAQAKLHMDAVYSVLRPTKGRWLGFVSGHHYYEFSEGKTSDTILADRLEAPFLGTCGIVQVRLETSAGKTSTCQLLLHHGEGSGRAISAPLNKLIPYAYSFPTIDIFLIGHYHKKIAYPIPAQKPFFSPDGRGGLKESERWLACTGGYLKGYEVGAKKDGRSHGNYVEQKMLTPNALGGIIIRIVPERIITSGHDYTRLDISVEY
jgi:hypothetical protein